MRLWKEQGFRLGLIGKNHCFSTSEDLALFDTLLELGHGGANGADWGRPPESIREASRARRELVDQNPRFGCATTDAPLEDQTTGLVTNASIRFLEEHTDQHSEEPFVLWASYPDPHEPWVCPEQYAAMFRGKVSLPPSCEGEFDQNAPQRNRVLHEMLGWSCDKEEDVLELLACYYGMMRCVDDGLGQLLDALSRLGLDEDTIVVFTSVRETSVAMSNCDVVLCCGRCFCLAKVLECIGLTSCGQTRIMETSWANTSSNAKAECFTTA
jgi:arylsulfatase A-like enzyme